MTCGELMSSEVVTCFANSPVYKAAEQMAEKDIGFIPIIDGEKKLIGVVTDRDLACKVVASRLDYETPIEQVMTRDVVTVEAGDAIEDAEQKMAERQLQRICVVDEAGSCIGVISLQDIARRTAKEEAGRVLQQVKEGELGPAVH